MLRHQARGPGRSGRRSARRLACLARLGGGLPESVTESRAELTRHHLLQPVAEPPGESHADRVADPSCDRCSRRHADPDPHAHADADHPGEPGAQPGVRACARAGGELRRVWRHRLLTVTFDACRLSRRRLL